MILTADGLLKKTGRPMLDFNMKLKLLEGDRIDAVLVANPT